MFGNMTRYFTTILFLITAMGVEQAVTAQTCSPAPVNLVSWWSADGNALDSRSRNNGTLENNVTFAAGQVGQTFRLGGTGDTSGNGDRVMIGNPTNLQLQDFTIETWIRRASSTIVTNSPGGGGAAGIFLSYGQGGYGFFIFGADNRLGLSKIGTSAVFSPTLPITDTSFHHVAVTKSGNQVVFYVDGAASAPQTFNETFTFTTNATIGSRGDNNAQDAFFGDIDEVSIYNRTLSAQEIAAIHVAGAAGKCKPTATTAPSGQVAWLAGDGNANDIAGTNNGTLQNGAGFAVGKVGQSFNLDGTDDFIELPTTNINFGANDFSIDLWFNLNTVSGEQTLFNKLSGGTFPNSQEYFLEANNGFLRFNVRDTTANENDLQVNATLQANTWYHVVAVRNGNTNRLFLNGVQIGQQIAGTNVNTGTGGVAYIGRLGSTAAARFVNGKIDEFSIYNRALTDSEITSIFNAGIAGKLKEAATAPGTNVSTNAGSDATINFASVSTAGTTQQIPLEPSVLPILPPGFSAIGLFYDIATTATFTGVATVCFNLPIINNPSTFSQLKVLHLESGTWVDRSSGQNFTSRTLCAQVSSLSPFAIAGGASPTAADAAISGAVTTVGGQPLAGVTMRLRGAKSATAITDASGLYRFDNLETGQLYSVMPALVNYHFNPGNLSFSLLANKTDAVFTGTPDAVIVGNAIDTAEYFVRQHYLDFLNREPDEAGFNFWSDQMLACGDDIGCLERKRINVSAAYFLSIEFQQTGGLVDSLYRASYGRAPRYEEFMRDTASIAQDIVVGRAGWQQKLVTKKRAFVDGWVRRPEFRADYDELSGSDYVHALISHIGVSFSHDERNTLVSSLNSSSSTRADVLLQIAEHEGFVMAKRNEAFVMMQYFGYLRRDPDQTGYQFWLNKLNEFEGNFERAEMVKAFINSGEYRARFLR